MQSALSKSLFAAILLVISVSCGNSKKENKENAVTGSDTVAKTSIATPDTAPAADKTTATAACYRNEGLKYNTIISITQDGNTISGSVAAGEIGADKLQIVTFRGTQDGNTLTVTFDGTPPVVGDASEWTNKPWTIIKDAAGDKLLIPFNAKNYETNAWQEMDYEFTLTPCGN